MPGLLPVPTTPAEFSPAPITDEPAATMSRAALNLIGTIGNIDLVPPARRVGGPGASHLMAPFTRVSTDRPSRFSRGRFGVLYAGRNSRRRCLRQLIIMHASWPRQTSQPVGLRSFAKSSLRQQVPIPLLCCSPTRTPACAQRSTARAV